MGRSLQHIISYRQRTLHGRESFVNTVKKNTTTQLLKSGLYKKLNLKDWYADFLGETYSNMRIF